MEGELRFKQELKHNQLQFVDFIWIFIQINCKKKNHTVEIIGKLNTTWIFNDIKEGLLNILDTMVL